MKSTKDIIFDMIMENKTEEMKKRFDIVNSKRIDTKVLEYLVNRFANLKINICGDYEGTLIQLMKKGLLEGWCWQTTETSIVFLNDEDYIERGNLKFSKYKNYYHSWICFKYEDFEYVLDPCLNILCDKTLYYETFEIEVKGKATAKEVKNALIDSINKYKKINETSIFGDEDVNAPMYRNNTYYKAEIENGKVKKLAARYLSC